MITLFHLVLALDFSSCMDLSCGDSTSICTKVRTSQVTVHQCKSGFTCPAAALTTLSSISDYGDYQCLQEPTCDFPNWSDGGLNPTGYPCCTNSDCESDTCTSQVCVGKQNNSSCSSSKECKAGSYCDGSCKTIQLTLGSSCTQDDECPEGSGCNNSKCTALISLGLGQNADNSKFCLSLYLNGGVCDSLIIYQGNSRLYEPFKCDIGSLCTYKYFSTGETAFTQNCACGGEENADEGYCLFVTPGVSTVDISQSLVYNDCDCSGHVVHQVDAQVLWNCGCIQEDSYDLYEHVANQRLYWPLYRTDAINDCADEFFETKHWAEQSAETLLFSFLVIILV